MAVYGHSTGITQTATEITVAEQGETLLSMADNLMWLRRKLATLLDQTVEPDDIEADDLARNTVR